MKTHKQNKRKAALERQDLYSKLTINQRIAKLNTRLGVDTGAAKERARLTKQAENQQPKV